MVERSEYTVSFLRIPYQVKLCFATIVSPNYLSYARVLADSVALQAPDAEFRVLIVGRPDPHVATAVEKTGLTVIYAHDLGLADFDHLSYKYDIVELNTALKPSFLKSIFALGFDKVVYLDPDIRLYAPPAPVLEALDGAAEILLIPHALAPVMDGFRPSDIDFMRTGSFNLGFIGLRKGVQAFAMLDWWEKRCLSHGFNDPSFGTFVDQKWLDLAPSYFEAVQVLKHPGCNVAYWNLHERCVAKAEGRYLVNGLPLIFFHFSGVNASAPEILSRHQNRHVLLSGTALAELVRDYCTQLLVANHQEWSKLPYAFGALDNGARITPTMRRAACVAGMNATLPFDPNSHLQQALHSAGLVPSAGQEIPAVTTMNFSGTDRRVAWTNALIRLLARIIGVGRVSLLIRYATFLGWGNNYAAVLLDRPFELRHIDERKVEPQ